MSELHWEHLNERCPDSCVWCRAAKAEKQVERLKGIVMDMYTHDDGQAWDEALTYFNRMGWNISLRREQQQGGQDND